MIPYDAKTDLYEIIQNEMFEMHRTLGSALAMEQSKLIARGLGMSGIMMQSLAEHARNSLLARGQVILGEILRCLAAHHVALDDETLNESKALLKDYVETQAEQIRSHLFSYPAFGNHGMEAARRQVEAQYGQEMPRLVTRLTAELRLAATASQTQSTHSGVASMIFNGPVGLVQSGSGNQATVNQHIDAGTKSQLLSALETYSAELEKPESNSIRGRDNLQELVSDARTELKKPNPNILKLSSGLRTIAETTKFIGSLRPAYEVLKPLLSLIGIHLP